MKPTEQISEFLTEIWLQSRREKFPIYIFLGLCLNLVLAPRVFAATGGTLSTTQSYFLAGLGLVILALTIYLFFVMFAPERF